MKIFTAALFLVSGCAFAAPSELLVERASVSDVRLKSTLLSRERTPAKTYGQAATGYASLNGGTTGGAGGTTTTVSSYAALATAVTGNNKKVIFVSGTITQTAGQIRPGNNTSIIGKNSSAKLVNFGM